MNWDLWVSPVSVLITALATLGATCLSNRHHRKVAAADRESKEQLARLEERRDALLATAEQSRLIYGKSVMENLSETSRVIGQPGSIPYPEAEQALLRVRLVCNEDLYRKARDLHKAASKASGSMQKGSSGYADALEAFSDACQEYLS